MKKKLKIEFYDKDAKLCDKVEGEYDGLDLLNILVGYADGELIPVVRLADVEKEKPCGDMPKVQFRKHEPFNWANEYIGKPVLMRLEMKVDQQTLSCEGFGHEVIKAQENFLRAIMPGFEGK